MEYSATFNHDRTRRTILQRLWYRDLPALCMIMLNPSDADEKRNDPTVARQITRASKLGCGSLIVLNAYDVVSSNPKIIHATPEPSSPENDETILRITRDVVTGSGMVICAWGPHTNHQGRHGQLLNMLAGIPLYALRVTKDGYPSHPLYLPFDIVPFQYPAPEVPAPESAAIW